ncbi:MAG: peptidylprolyl isomerase [Rhodothermaceae bacterium]|nr:peptidylprolyl isomerase [Rhodothermaceae bacterium]
MNKMRENTASVLWVLVFAFGGLWVLQDSGAFESIGLGAGRDIARVNGEAVLYEQYQAAVQQRTDLYQQQGVEITPAIRARIEDEVYNALIDNRLREEEMDRLGVGVSDAEVEAAITGDNPDPFIRQLFGDGQGGVDQARLGDFVAAAGQDPAVREQLILIEDQVRLSRRQAKLDALIQATARVSEGEVEAEYLRRNTLANAEYIALRYADVPEDEVEVTDRDLRRFYDDHREDFERPATYAIEYVGFEKVPSPEDSARVRQELARLKPQLEAAEDPSAFVSANAYGDAEAAFVAAGDMLPELADAVYSDLTVGRIAGPVLAGDAGYLVEILGVQPAENPSVRARHILLPLENRATAETLKTRLEQGEIGFEQAALQYSTDESNKNQGGDLGWFGAGRMVQPFEEAAFAAPVGTIVGPVETSFGYHLIRVESRATQEAEIVRLSVPLQSDDMRLIEEGEDLQYYAEAEEGSFADEARRRGYRVQQATVQAEQQAIPGLQVGRDALRWIRRADEGEISEPFDAGTHFAVFHLTGITPEGVRPFDEVREQLEPRVMVEKKKAVQLERLREALSSTSDLNALASQLGTTVETASNLALPNPIILGVGREPAVVGTLFGLDVGEQSGVIEGASAAFVARPTSFDGGDLANLTDEARQTIRQQLLDRKRQQVLQMWLQSLRDEAEIEDFRDTLL